MADKVVIRPAAERDIDYIVETIIRSQKSGTGNITYCNLYDLSEKELIKILQNILQEDLEGIEGHEFCLSGFLICEINDERAGALGAWVEGKDGMPSSIIKTNLFLKHLGREKFENAVGNFETIKELYFDREENAVQLEYLQVEENFWLKGVFVKLIIAQIKKNMEFNECVNKVQAIMFKDNDRSYLAFHRIGFKTIEEKTALNKDILKVYPHRTRILMELNRSDYHQLLTRFERFLNNTEMRI